DPIRKSAYLEQLKQYALRAKIHQETRTLTGLGEPKFHVNSEAFNEPWGRPQADGPALRSLTLIRVARILLERGQGQFVQQFLYDGRLPSRTVIKRDLEYVAAEWRKPSFDLWEEVLGHHYYTLAVQFRSLLE